MNVSAQRKPCEYKVCANIGCKGATNQRNWIHACPHITVPCRIQSQRSPWKQTPNPITMETDTQPQVFRGTWWKQTPNPRYLGGLSVTPYRWCISMVTDTQPGYLGGLSVTPYQWCISHGVDNHPLVLRGVLGDSSQTWLEDMVAIEKRLLCIWFHPHLELCVWSHQV